MSARPRQAHLPAVVPSAPSAVCYRWFPSAAVPPAPSRPRPAPSPVAVTPAELRIFEGLALGPANVGLDRTLHLSRRGLHHRIDRLGR